MKFVRTSWTADPAKLRKRGIVKNAYVCMISIAFEMFLLTKISPVVNLLAKQGVPCRLTSDLVILVDLFAMSYYTNLTNIHIQLVH